jgi:acetyltransferase
MKDGVEVIIGPIRPEDEPLIVKFHESLSEESVYLRYFHMAKLSTWVAHDEAGSVFRHKNATPIVTNRSKKPA